MKRKIVPLLLCSNCGSDGLELNSFDAIGDEVNEGILVCRPCRIWYRIEEGIADLLPLNLRRNKIHEDFAKNHNIPFNNSEPQNLSEKEKISQMNFFRDNVGEYERKVVNSKYYHVLDQVIFIDWICKNLHSGDTVLELGCGTGRQCIPLARQGIATVGIDISEEMLIYAKEKIRSFNLQASVDLIVGDATNPPVKNDFFNACIIYGSLHHFPDKSALLQNAIKKIRHRGLFFSLDPNDSPFRMIFDLAMKVWKLYNNDDVEDNYLLSEKWLSQCLLNAGVQSRIRYSTFILPHVFYLFNNSLNIKLLRLSDIFCNKFSFLRHFGGAIIAEGIKQKSSN